MKPILLYGLLVYGLGNFVACSQQQPLIVYCDESFEVGKNIIESEIKLRHPNVEVQFYSRSAEMLKQRLKLGAKCHYALLPTYYTSTKKELGYLPFIKTFVADAVVLASLPSYSPYLEGYRQCPDSCIAIAPYGTSLRQFSDSLIHLWNNDKLRSRLVSTLTAAQPQYYIKKNICPVGLIFRSQAVHHKWVFIYKNHVSTQLKLGLFKGSAHPTGNFFENFVNDTLIKHKLAAAGYFL